MRPINLKEYESSGPYALSVEERDALQAQELGVTVQPAVGLEGEYNLRASSIVGAVEMGDLSVLIEPKIGIRQLLSIACYAMGAYKSQEQRLFDFEEDQTLPDTLVLALSAAARRAFSRGLLHDYLTREEALYTVRGRIRFDEQIRRRFGIPMPVEVRYEEFTDDILANRLVKAAAARLGTMRLRSQRARRGLGWTAGMLDNVSPVEFAPKDVPEVRFDRLNEHYREVVGLARLILQHSAFESGRGLVRASGFLMDMNVVFQEFVTVALREALEVSERTFRSDTDVRSLTLNEDWDEVGKVHLYPDLSWWDDQTCTFVGDAKYKNLTNRRVPNEDLYQLLAYVTALDLPGGMLIYAEGEADTATYHVRHSGKRLEVAALDLSGSLGDILDRITEISCRIRELRRTSRTLIHSDSRVPVFRVPVNASPISTDDVRTALSDWP